MLNRIVGSSTQTFLVENLIALMYCLAVSCVASSNSMMTLIYKKVEWCALFKFHSRTIYPIYMKLLLTCYAWSRREGSLYPYFMEVRLTSDNRTEASGRKMLTVINLGLYNVDRNVL